MMIRDLIGLPTRTDQEAIRSAMALLIPERCFDPGRALRERVRLVVEPGRRTELTAPSRKTPELSVNLERDGTITVGGNAAERGRGKFLLPRPETPDREGRPGRYLDTSGTGITAVTDYIQDFLAEKWRLGLGVPQNLPKGALEAGRGPGGESVAYLSRELAWMARTEMAQRPEGPPWQDAQRELNDRMETAVSGMVDPEAWDIARELGREVTLDRYNWAMAAGRFLGKLRESNPGAVIWLLVFCPYEGPVNHPGQLITAARSHLERSGLGPGNWRAAARLPESVMRAATEWPRPETAADVLNAVAESGCVPSFQAVRAANMVIGKEQPPGEREGHLPENRRRNVRRAMALAFRGEAQNGPAPARGLTAAVEYVSGFREAADYAGAMADHGRDLTSTTWGGLSKAARRWRREMTEEMLRDQWAQLMTQREGRIQAWTSLLGETRAGASLESPDGLNAVPITSEYGLYQESIAMGHCVFSYGNRCGAGVSRIFSLRRKGERIATGEIVQMPGGWTVSQVRSHGNRQATGDAHAAMGAIAALYENEQRREDGEDGENGEEHCEQRG